MGNHIDVLATSNELKKKKISHTTKKSNGESFSNIFYRIITKENDDSLKTNSINLEKPIVDFSRIEETKRIDNALERLAGFFGIGKHLMAAILESLHIDPKDLLDPGKTKDIVRALTKKFGLSKDKTDALLDLIINLQN